MAAILKIGRHLDFSNGQSGNFDQKHQLNVSRKFQAYIIIARFLSNITVTSYTNIAN